MAPAADAVDAIISQAMDQIALEQVARLNTSHLSDDAVLPTHLESRFRRLKSLPSGRHPQSHTSHAIGDSTVPKPSNDEPKEAQEVLRSPARDLEEEKPPERPISDVGFEEDKKVPDFPNQSKSSPTPPPERKAPEPSKLAASNIASRQKSRGEFVPSPKKSSPDSSRDSPSPPRRQQSCCFGFSPRKLSSTSSSQKKREKESGYGDVNWGEKEDELLSGLESASFSLKEHKRIMKKVMKEQDKVSRETEKLVRMMKQASARMDMSAIDDLLSDVEEEKIV